MIEFIFAIIVLCAVAYGVFRALRKQAAQRQAIEREKAISAFRLRISNRAHEQHISLGEAELSLIADGVIPPSGWCGYTPYKE